MALFELPAEIIELPPFDVPAAPPAPTVTV
jgi:hypothetical protein